MPFAQISILEGRSDELKAELIREVTDAIHRSIGAPKESVRVAIYEVKKSAWGIGGETAASLGR
jgi:4-oxalocrotonate tautomerase